MTIVTIPHLPRSLPRGEYVLVPKPDYEELVQRVRMLPTVAVTAKDRRSIAHAEREIKDGKYRPWKQAKHELDRFHNLDR